MRLSPKEIASILKGLSEVEFLQDPYELFLFGSRTDVHKLGGDIDLLLIVSASDYDRGLTNKHRLVVSIKKYIEDQRVDLTIRTREKLVEDPFYQSIAKSLVRLK